MLSQSIRVNNFLSGSSGFKIDGGGNAEFNNVIVRGTVEIYGPYDGIYVGDGGAIVVTDSAGTSVFDTASKFRGGTVKYQGTCGYFASGSGEPPSYCETTIWNGVSRTVPSGKKWIVICSPMVGEVAEGKYTALTTLCQVSDIQRRGHEWTVAGYFHTSSTLYGSELPAGSYTGLYFKVKGLVRLYAAERANDKWGTCEVYWQILEIPA